MTLPYVWRSIAPSTDLQKTIINSTANRQIRWFSDRRPEISAPIDDLAAAVESAYILTAKEDLPKVTDAVDGSFSIEEFGALYPHGSRTPENARKRAAAWLAVAAHLEREEKAKAAADATEKAVAKAAEAARKRRLDELADEWFGEDFFSDLSTNKAAAVKEIYRLETTLEERDKA